LLAVGLLRTLAAAAAAAAVAIVARFSTFFRARALGTDA